MHTVALDGGGAYGNDDHRPHNMLLHQCSTTLVDGHRPSSVARRRLARQRMAGADQGDGDAALSDFQAHQKMASCLRGHFLWIKRCGTPLVKRCHY